MQAVIGVCLVPFILGLALTLALRAWLREGAAWWAIVMGLVLAVGLFVAARYFSYHCGSGDSCRGDNGDLSELDYILPILGFVLWLLGVGAAAGLSRLTRGDNDDRPSES
jgi:predicted Na+-dependent transporter